MSVLKTSEIRQKDVASLREMVCEFLREKFNLLMQRGSQQKVKSHLFKQVRRNIARIKTVIREKIKSEQSKSEATS